MKDITNSYNSQKEDEPIDSHKTLTNLDKHIFTRTALDAQEIGTDAP